MCKRANDVSKLVIGWLNVILYKIYKNYTRIVMFVNFKHKQKLYIKLLLQPLFNLLANIALMLTLTLADSQVHYYFLVTG